MFRRLLIFVVLAAAFGCTTTVKLGSINTNPGAPATLADKKLAVAYDFFSDRLQASDQRGNVWIVEDLKKLFENSFRSKLTGKVAEIKVVSAAKEAPGMDYYLYPSLRVRFTEDIAGATFEADYSLVVKDAQNNQVASHQQVGKGPLNTLGSADNAVRTALSQAFDNVTNTALVTIPVAQ